MLIVGESEEDVQEQIRGFQQLDPDLQQRVLLLRQLNGPGRIDHSFAARPVKEVPMFGAIRRDSEEPEDLSEEIRSWGFQVES